MLSRPSQSARARLRAILQQRLPSVRRRTDTVGQRPVRPAAASKPRASANKWPPACENRQPARGVDRARARHGRGIPATPWVQAHGQSAHGGSRSGCLGRGRAAPGPRDLRPAAAGPDAPSCEASSSLVPGHPRRLSVTGRSKRAARQLAGAAIATLAFIAERVSEGRFARGTRSAPRPAYSCVPCSARSCGLGLARLASLSRVYLGIHERGEILAGSMLALPRRRASALTPARARAGQLPEPPSGLAQDRPLEMGTYRRAELSIDGWEVERNSRRTSRR